MVLIFSSRWSVAFLELRLGVEDPDPFFRTASTGVLALDWGLESSPGRRKLSTLRCVLSPLFRRLVDKRAGGCEFNDG